MSPEGLEGILSGARVEVLIELCTGMAHRRVLQIQVDGLRWTVSEAELHLVTFVI